jgi:hypothetical protein
MELKKANHGRRIKGILGGDDKDMARMFKKD